MTAVTNTFSTKKFYNIKVLSRFYLFFSSSQHQVYAQVFLWGCTGLVYSLSGKTQGIKYLWAHSNNLRQLRQAYQHFYQLISLKFLKNVVGPQEDSVQSSFSNTKDHKE